MAGAHFTSLCWNPKPNTMLNASTVVALGKNGGRVAWENPLNRVSSEEGFPLDKGNPCPSNTWGPAQLSL